MARMEAHTTTLDYNEGANVLIHPASDTAVSLVLAADPESDEGRSNWVWVRLPNGDLVLGIFPQGDTYFSIENDAHFSGEPNEILWCEQCGERPQMVRTDHAGLCCACAADTIGELMENA